QDQRRLDGLLTAASIPVRRGYISSNWKIKVLWVDRGLRALPCGKCFRATDTCSKKTLGTLSCKARDKMAKKLRTKHNPPGPKREPSTMKIFASEHFIRHIKNISKFVNVMEAIKTKLTR
ncbi:hypothetical protein CUMW_161230, partial [Citrus unshiu]